MTILNESLCECVYFSLSVLNVFSVLSTRKRSTSFICDTVSLLGQFYIMKKSILALWTIVVV